MRRTIEKEHFTHTHTHTGRDTHKKRRDYKGHLCTWTLAGLLESAVNQKQNRILRY